MRMRSLYRFTLLCGVLLLAACQGPPPTQYVLVVTATPEPTEVMPTEEPSETPPPPTATPTRVTPSLPTRATPVAPAALPTPTFAQIQVAEQIFENGRMFWLEPIRQIWVMVETGDGVGVWTVHEDLFEEGDPEFDPSIVPPEDRFQPERGFGRLWRDNAEVREAVGWALEAELGHVSNYEYQPAGTIEDGVFVPAPGYHVLSSFYGESYRFNEINGTWQTVRRARR